MTDFEKYEQWLNQRGLIHSARMASGDQMFFLTVDGAAQVLAEKDAEISKFASWNQACEKQIESQKREIAALALVALKKGRLQ